MTEDDCCGGADDDAPAVGSEDLPEGDDPGHVVPEADLQYPTIEFDEGEVADDGGFDLSQPMGRDDMADVAEALAGALGSHDLGVETPDGFVTFGVGPGDVDVSFDPDEDHRGDLEVTFSLSAKAMFVADADTPKVGSRGGKGFVPLSTLTGEQELTRCYNWISDPENPD